MSRKESRSSRDELSSAAQSSIDETDDVEKEKEKEKEEEDVACDERTQHAT